jgi:hypothetical protein
MAGDASLVLLGTVVPILGGLVAIVMYLSPLKAACAARQKQQLGVSDSACSPEQHC